MKTVLGILTYVYCLLFGLSFAQNQPWPPKLESGQVWRFVLEGSGQQFVWNVQLGALRNNAFDAKVDGLDKRDARVAYFPDAVPGTNFKDVLVFDFKAPSVASGFDKPFTCVIFNNWRGNIPFAVGTTCTATLGAAPAVSSSPSVIPDWFKSGLGSAVPSKGQLWNFTAFATVWEMTLEQPEADGFSGKATLVRSAENGLPKEWNFRLVYQGNAVRVDIQAGAATVSCVLQSQQPSQLSFGGTAGLFQSGVSGAQQQSECRFGVGKFR